MYLNFGAFIIAPLEILLVLAIIFLILSPGKLAGIGRSVGKMVSNFRQASKADVDSSDPKISKKDNSEKDK